MLDLSENDEALKAYFPFIRKNIKELCLKGKLGLIGVSIKDIVGECYNHQQFANVLKLKIPYAGKKLQWDIVFNPETMDFAPDFSFNDDLFMANMDMNWLVENLPSWANWDIKNPQSLSNVLKEFLLVYKKQELDKLSTDNSFEGIKMQLENVIEKKKLELENVEVFIENNHVHLLITLQIDFSNLPKYMQPDPDCFANFGQDYALLRVSFMGPNRTNTSLFLSPRMEQILLTTQPLHIPEYNKDASLLEYLENVTKIVNLRIEAKISDHQKRQRFIAHFVALNPDKLIEYDNMDLLNVTITYNVDDYDYLLDIITDDHFPHRKPKIVMINECERLNCREAVKNYPWNKTDSEKDIINNILTFLQEVLPDLRRNHRH